MTKKTKNLLRGIGSVMDISPNVNKFLRLVPKQNAKERMKSAWDKTGLQISDAIDKYSDGKR